MTNHLNMNTILTAVCAQKLVEVLQELLDFHWTRAAFLLLIVPEVQQHVDLKINRAAGFSYGN